MLRITITLTLILFSIFLLTPSTCFAYLDPGSGSYLIQIIIASLAGVGYLLKVNWEKVKNIFAKKETVKSDVKEEPKK